MAFTVIVVVSLVATGLVGDTSSTSARQKILQDVYDETGIATSSQDVDHPPQRDLRLGRCERNADGVMVTGGSVTNFTSDPATYRIVVVFRGGSGSTLGPELASTIVDVADVASERTVTWSATSGVVPAGDFTCRVASVERAP